ELHEVVRAHQLVDAVPLAAPLAEVGVVGVAGPGEFGAGSMRALLAQVVALHSPAEVALVALLSTEHADRWSWLSWLPHVDPIYSPLDGPSIGVGGNGAGSLALALRELVDRRSGSGPDESGPAERSGAVDRGGRVVVLVDDDVPVERSLLV